MRTYAARRHQQTWFELLEPRFALTASFVISEFMADNKHTLLDRYGAASDWIEIHNVGSTSGSLNGYYLTDDPADKLKWQFPDKSLAADGYLTVFADKAHNDRDPANELHTGFSLDNDGEYLALIAPDGVTVVQEFAPTFPRQQTDVSYGIGPIVANYTFTGPGTPAKTIIPTAANHATYDSVWKNQNYAPDANWINGTQGVGFSQSVSGFLVRTYLANTTATSPIGTTVDTINEALAVIGDPAARAAVQSSTVAGNYAQIDFRDAANGTGGHYTVNAPFPGLTNSATDYNNFATEAHARITIPAAGNWTFGVTSNEGFLLDIDDFEMARTGTGSGDQLATFNFDAAGVYDLDLYYFEKTGSSGLELYAAQGSFAAWNSTNFKLVGATGGLAVTSDVVYPNGGTIAELLGTDVGTQMQSVNSTLYTRSTFSVVDPAALDQLTLRVKYDDGFIAYVNGVEVARRNFSGTPAWNSIASAARTGQEVLTSDTIDLTAFISALTPGQNVLAIQCLNISAGNSDALVLPQLTAVDNVASSGLAYFTSPTPGAANFGGFLGYVKDTSFSEHRGFFDAPLDVAITSNTPGAQIYYTTDGQAPSQSNGSLYTGPIHITHTTALRAVAFQAGYIPTNVDTETYLFLNDVIQQDEQATLDAGFPTHWGSFTPDYGLDPRITSAFNAATIKEGLLSIPTVSIVMNTDDLFGLNGIYRNSTQRTDNWEKPTSVEWITPDGSPEFQIDAGIRIQGAYFRDNTHSLKHSFRLLFKSQYGDSKLDFPLFDNGAVSEFNTIILRAGANDSYSWNSARYTEQYIRDEFNRSLQVDSGNVTPHGNFVHLYINGIYWGLYNPVERADQDFAASYLGGNADSWDIVHRGGGTFSLENGNLTAWNAMLAKAAQAGSSLAAYMELQGKNLNGTPNPATPALLDVASYARYILINAWGGNWDWPRNNFWAGRNPDAATTTGFEFFGWDAENTIGNNLSRSPLNADVFDPTKTPGNDFTGSDNAGQPHVSLLPNTEYKLLFADEVQKMFFNGGILTPSKLIERYQALADGVELAMIGESARWGDMHYPTAPLTLTDWQTERDWILNTYLPQRTAIVLGQFKNYGLFPNVDAPVFSQFGGNYAGGFKLSMTNPNTGGNILYTLDGSDPRLLGGAQNPAAKTYSGAFLLSGNVTVKARYLSAGGVWSAIVETPFMQNAIGLYPGDFNRDGGLTPDDVPAMLSALTDVDAYCAGKSLSPADLVAIGDLSGDGNVSNGDIQALLDRLASQSQGGGSGVSSGSGSSASAEPAVVPQSPATEQSAPLATISSSGSAIEPLVFADVFLASTNNLVHSESKPIGSHNPQFSPESVQADSLDTRVDDFYRQLNLMAKKDAENHRTAADRARDTQVIDQNCTDALLAGLIDPRFSHG